MPRVKGGPATRQRRKRVLKLAKGYYGDKSKKYRVAKQAVMKSGNYAYRDRKAKKRDFRRVWIARINAAARMNGMSYSSFITCHKSTGDAVHRKVLAELAVHEQDAIAALVALANQ